MSTDATIAVERADGTIEGVYLKWDGGLSHTGRLLLARFFERQAVEHLVSLGPIPSICAYIRKTSDTTWRCHLEQDSASRDLVYKGYRPRPKTPRRFRDREALVRDGDEYVYLFDREGCWHWTRFHGPLAPLTAADTVAHGVPR